MTDRTPTTATRVRRVIGTEQGVVVPRYLAHQVDSITALPGYPVSFRVIDREGRGGVVTVNFGLGDSMAPPTTATGDAEFVQAKAAILGGPRA